MYLYQRLYLFEIAVFAARQSATTWDNSKKNLEDGFLADCSGKDGLYWRLLDDYQLRDGFGKVMSESPLVGAKCDKARGYIMNRLRTGIFKNPCQIEVGYTNILLKRSVVVKISQSVFIPYNFLAELLNKRLVVQTEAVVVEPDEFIRTFVLVEEYVRKSSAGNDTNTGSSVFASSKRMLYHYPDCISLKRIKEENLITFQSEAKARAQGYRLCFICAENRLKQYEEGLHGEGEE